ncbi:hypothetical protein [Prevotella sp. 10(H)]|uniref:hypothetical protein n=1 Tax=Prevotella sp. 10(H) TaxID=1158294 RepID=UPI000AB76A49|nr:hypothetical protein [Prevotella sp. 10(H)]
MTGTIQGQDEKKTVEKKVPQPKIKAVNWATQTGKKTNKGEYGKELYLHVDTEFAQNSFLSAFIVIHSDDWPEDYLSLRRVTKYDLFGRGETNEFGISIPNPNAPEKTIFNLTPNADWLSDAAIDESEITAIVYIFCYMNILPIEDNSPRLREINDAIKRDDNAFRNYSSVRENKPMIVDQKETEKIKIRKTVNVPWVSRAFEEMQLGVREGTNNDATSPVKYLNYEGVPKTMRSISEATAWCGAFVNYVLEETGYTGQEVNPLAVENWNGTWRTWGDGVEIDEPSYGALVTFGDTHIGLVVGMSKDETELFVLGGNQADEVNVSKYAIKTNFKYFLPQNYTPFSFENDPEFLKESYEGTITNGSRTT